MQPHTHTKANETQACLQASYAVQLVNASTTKHNYT